jgi:hypothetical protein
VAAIAVSVRRGSITTISGEFLFIITRNIIFNQSKKKFNEDGYERHKIFLYKEDFNKFLEAMNETVNHVKTDLLPEYDFDEFSKNDDYRQDDFSDDKPVAKTNSYSSDAAPKSETPSEAKPSASFDDDDLSL